MHETVPLKVSKETYNNLIEARKIEIEEAIKNQDVLKIGMLKAMGTGAYGGYIIYQQLNGNGFSKK